MTETINGTTIIRDAMYARSRRGHIGWLAREIGCSVDAIESFIQGKGQLPAAAKDAFVKIHWSGHATYVEQFDALKKTNKNPPKPAGVMPAPLGDLLGSPGVFI